MFKKGQLVRSTLRNLYVVVENAPLAFDNKPEDFQVRAFCNTKRLSKDK